MINYEDRYNKLFAKNVYVGTHIQRKSKVFNTVLSQKFISNYLYLGMT